MAKKNKKNKIKSEVWDNFVFGPFVSSNEPKEGALRFHQKIVEKTLTKWYGIDYKELGRSEKVLQQFNGKDWVNIPFERDYIEI